jgi:hypothetical protein
MQSGSDDKKELNLQQKQQMEAIKLLSDWSKWLITIETASIAGIISIIKVTEHTLWLNIISILLVLTALCFLFSIFNACKMVFSLPNIVQYLPESKVETIDKMKDEYFQTTLFNLTKRQYLSFLWGLGFLALALIIWAASSLWK